MYKAEPGILVRQRIYYVKDHSKFDEDFKDLDLTILSYPQYYEVGENGIFAENSDGSFTQLEKNKIGSSRKSALLLYVQWKFTV